MFGEVLNTRECMGEEGAAGLTVLMFPRTIVSVIRSTAGSRVRPNNRPDPPGKIFLNIICHVTNFWFVCHSNGIFLVIHSLYSSVAEPTLFIFGSSSGSTFSIILAPAPAPLFLLFWLRL